MKYSRKFILERLFVCEITIVALEGELSRAREAWEWWTRGSNMNGSLGRHLMISYKSVLANLRSIRAEREHWLREWEDSQGNPLNSENVRDQDSGEE